MKSYKWLTVLLIAILVGIFVFLYVICNWNYLRFNEKWMIGKTAEEIVEKYGEFDIARSDPPYVNTICGYVIHEKKVGYLGTKPEVCLLIKFDENGLACKCYEELAGIGG